MVEKALITYFKTDAPLLASLGGRLYPHKLPEGATLPAATYQVIVDNPYNAHEGLTRLVLKRVQLTVWGATYEQAKEAGAQVLTSLSNWARGQLPAGNDTLEFEAAIALEGTEFFDNTAQVWAVTRDFNLFYQR